jgi:hypothetical protein
MIPDAVILLPVYVLLLHGLLYTQDVPRKVRLLAWAGISASLFVLVLPRSLHMFRSGANPPALWADLVLQLTTLSMLGLLAVLLWLSWQHGRFFARFNSTRLPVKPGTAGPEQ